jgi:hypothetical protein
VLNAAAGKADRGAGFPTTSTASWPTRRGSITGFTIGAMWNQRALTATPVSAAKMATVADRVAKCDAIDGWKDALIDDPQVHATRPGARRGRSSAGADTTRAA